MGALSGVARRRVADGAGMTARVLLVDDVAANTRLLEARLVADYYVVASAEAGGAALRLAAEWCPDVILLDVMMPGMDGFEVCRRLKAIPATSHIPVVMVTALDHPNERVRGLDAGADDFLTKPVAFDTLLARVRGLVRLKRMLDEWRARAETARALGLTAVPAEPNSVAGARVLVVDDREAEARQFQEWLTREEMLPGLARSGAEMRALLTAIRFDLIVLSLSLGAEDALALASGLRAGDLTSDIPLLLIAEPEGRERTLRGFDLGANDWLLRPVDPNELRARARNQVRRRIYQNRLRADLDQALVLAFTDPLTGLYNQRYVVHHLSHLIASPQRNGLAVLMIDVDHFKRVNDSFGHPTGDRVLKAVAETLRGNLRVFDTLARYGGEEFVVVMPGAGLGEAASAGERLRDAVAQMRFVPEGRTMPHRLTVSIGVVSSEGAEFSAESLLQAADGALDGAKREGRNRVELAAT
ncbi:MAG: PleD family two-component system response regulator, partial [Acetobacteraceae bacterium]